MTRVAIFTDNDFAKVNGVTTTLKALVRYAPADVSPRIYTLADTGTEQADYLALRSVGVPIPFYGEMAMYVPRLRSFRRHLVSDGVEVIHLTTPGPAGLAARYLAAGTRTPLVGSFHTQLAEYTELLSGSRTLSSGMRHYMRWLYGTCAPVLVPSEDTRQSLLMGGWLPHRLGVWPRGVDTGIFSPVRRSDALREHWGVSERCPAILYAGRLSREKGLALLAPILARLRDERRNCRLIVVGDGPMRPELRAACPDAVFTGTLPHDEVAIAMASCDLFVFPSSTDTAGNVVLEAQASGLPVVVSDRGGPRENILNGETGYVSRSGDPGDFGRSVAALLDPVLRTRFSSAARQYAGGRTWELSLAPVYALYRATGRADVASLGATRATRGVAVP